MWVRTYNGPGDGFDQSRKIAVDKSGNSHITGRSFGDGTQYDYATIKYNTLGIHYGLRDSTDWKTVQIIQPHLPLINRETRMCRDKVSEAFRTMIT